MTRPLVIVGCGGFGREVLDVVDAVNAIEPQWDFLGFVDDGPTEDNLAIVDRMGHRVLGGVSWLDQAPPDTAVFIGIGDGAVKERIDKAARTFGLDSGVLIHPTASVGALLDVAPGTIICAGVRITTNVRIGRHVHVNLGATVGHDTELGDYVSVNPLAAISGNVTIGARAMVGTQAAILQGLTVGMDSTIGGAAMVVKDVSENVVVKGVPAR
ncbi:sugar O-acetyltransferase [Knoellia sinensis KCTC 19936]|uniref:Sugar O-acetyltransferase n=1 Tax=Knoellia sinensis KCTC 19936 TaxID=1385520 RepID=A0A0A0JBJ6_9MICO|nr:acetyltransferase [Knoellia sinensis]KGN32981.1 sugar O-acetyltransferase [Knoellia sinensis KCTC 19936]